MKPRVFAVHQPTGRNEHGRVHNTVDLSPAQEYGELRFLLPHNENPHADIEATAGAVQRAMEAEGFSERDWLLLVGNPVLIGLVSAIAYEMTGRLRVLQWDRTPKRYLPVDILLDDGQSSGGDAAADAA